MALIVKDRVKESSTTTGTADFTLGGAASGFQTFAVIGNSNTTYYAAVDQATGDWEVGVGTYSSTGPTLTRDTVLESSNSGSKVSFAAGSKDVFCTYPAERSVYLDAAGSAVSVLDIGTLGVSTANITTANITAGTVTTTPASGNDLVNKTYVDTLVASGIHFHQPVRVESPINLNATYNNGTAGVGATLTNAGTQVALVIDGITVATNDRVLVYEQTNETQNGIYVVTSVGSGSTNWVLTRASDADTYVINSADGLSEGSSVFVQQGTTGAGETYTCNTSGTITFGTTNITFAQISSAQIYSAGTGLTLSGTQFSITNTGTAGTYGSASSVPVFSTNAQGQVTSATPTAIAIAAAAVSGLAASATTDTTNAANITSGTLPTGRLNGSYTGITGVGTLTAGTWNASTIAATRGGTGLTSFVQGDLLYATSSTTIGSLADAVAGNALISGGVGGDPAWGKIGLSTHVSGTLPVGNGGTGATTLTGYVYGNGTGAFTASTSIPNAATTATNLNTASAIVARDGSGNFSAGTITASLNGNASTATTAANVNNGTLTLGVSGTGLSGSATFTANQSGNSTFTVASNATNLNTVSTIVARDASGNFSAGTVTAALSGNATTATTLATTRTIWGQNFNGSANVTGDLSGVTTLSVGDGTAAAPSIRFTGDTDTGIYRVGTNTLGITTGGTQAAFFDGSGNTKIVGNLAVAAAPINSSIAIYSSISLSANAARYAAYNQLTITPETLTADRAYYGAYNRVLSTAQNSVAAAENRAYGAWNEAYAYRTTTNLGAGNSVDNEGVLVGAYNYASLRTSDPTFNRMESVYGSINAADAAGGSVILSVATVSGSTTATINGAGQTTAMIRVGDFITTNDAIPAGATVASIVDSASFTISAAATITQTDTSTTFTFATSYIDNAFGSQHFVTANYTGATVNNAYGSYSLIRPIATGATINNGYLFYGTNSTVAGTFTNRYGVYIVSAINNYVAGGMQVGGTALGGTSAAGLGVNAQPAGAGTITMTGQLTNTLAIGTAPFVVTSTTRVANLNVATAGTADVLTTARTIGGVSFNGSANIDLPGVNTAGNQNTSGTAAISTAATVTTSATASAFKVPFANTTASTTGNYGLLQDSEATFTYNPSTNTLVAGTFSGALSGNATTATTLQTARTIGGVSFNGSADINLPGVNTAGNQNTSGNAATATALSSGQGNWAGTGVLGNVVGLMAWKEYGSSHVIFDASDSTSPSGGAVNNTNAAVAWTATYPTLMGWNGSTTYGVRVDSARIADSITSQANSATITASTAATANQIVLRDGNGDDYRRYGFADYFNMSHGVSGSTTDTIFYSSGDNYIRKNNATGLRGSLNVPTRTGGDASGTWGINITGNAATATNASNTSSISNAVGTSYTWTAANLFTGNGNTASAAGIGMQAYSTGGNGAVMAFHRGGQYAVNMGLDSDNVIRIGGWSASANRLQMDMSGNLTMAGNVTAYSDERLKKDWSALPVDFVERLATVKSGTYTRIDSDERQAGSSAQDWQKLLPEVVMEGADDDKTLSLAYGNAALVSAVELAKRVAEQDARIAKLEALVAQLTKGNTP